MRMLRCVSLFHLSRLFLVVNSNSDFLFFCGCFFFFSSPRKIPDTCLSGPDRPSSFFFFFFFFFFFSLFPPGLRR
ncbi:hypothetical protein F4803DRAFT_468609 [Xylaria telfairii]|nr:hypothetical protein F4803DRAFT_468609 [Xylaria telfairii]